MANPSLIPTLIPTSALAFSDDEWAGFAALDDDADLDAICDALFPDQLTKG
ncbi:MAG: hypothetical protein HYS27_15525 [Deltaproteobacteria bacterium]|nr:hypothetical protein [Deltaproteobacteria bacterium]